MGQTLHYVSSQFDTEDQQRHGLTQILKSGLMPFISQTPMIEEILLKEKKLATSYDISLRVGLRYSFGLIYNNIVKRRFQLMNLVSGFHVYSQSKKTVFATLYFYGIRKVEMDEKFC